MLLSELIRYSLVVCLFMQIQTPPLQPISLMESYNLPLIGALDHISPSYMIPFVNMYHTHYLFCLNLYHHWIIAMILMNFLLP